jgi:hypothetical protein
VPSRRVSSPPPLHTCGGATTAAPRTVREVDWCNRSYVDAVSLTGGWSEQRAYVCDLVPGHEGEHTTDLVHLVDLAYGDIDRDDVDDVALLFDHTHHACEPAWSTRTSAIHAFSVRDAEVILLGAWEVRLGGDRRLTIVDGEVALVHADGGIERWRL